MQIWKMGRKKLKFTRIEKNGQCLNECMELCLSNNFSFYDSFDESLTVYLVYFSSHITKTSFYHRQVI